MCPKLLLEWKTLAMEARGDEDVKNPFIEIYPISFINSTVHDCFETLLRITLFNLFPR